MGPKDMDLVISTILARCKLFTENHEILAFSHKITKITIFSPRAILTAETNGTLGTV